MFKINSKKRAGNIPNLITGINLHIQEAQETLINLNAKKYTM